MTGVAIVHWVVPRLAAIRAPSPGRSGGEGWWHAAADWQGLVLAHLAAFVLVAAAMCGAAVGCCWLVGVLA